MIGLVIVILFYIFYNIKLNSYESFESLSKVPLIERPSNWSQLKFNEKINTYGKKLNKNHSIFADKLRIKEIIKKFNLPDLHHAKLIKVLNKNDNSLNLQELPKNCVIKSNNGWNDIIIVKNGKIDLMVCRGEKLNPKIQNYKIWKKKALSTFINEREQQYQYIKPEVFVEEYLGNSLSDYKFYCIHGKVQFSLFASGRFGKLSKNYYDKNLNKLNIRVTDDTISNDNFNLSKNELKIFKRMIEMSEIISNLFEFARIDFYLIDNKIYFGEITLTPAGRNMNIKPESFNKKLGLEWL